MANDYAEKADELEEILRSMKELLAEARRTLRRTGMIGERAGHY
jgi:hypothetical protein